MKLAAAIKAYVAAKRALGYIFVSDDRMLRSFARSVGNVPLRNVTPEMCEAFYRKRSLRDTMPPRKHQCLRCFFQFVVTRGYLGASPLPPAPPRRKSGFQPYIYTRQEIRRILDATDRACPPGSFIPARTLRTLLLTLYAAGLRSGEAVRLRRRDVDLEANVLSIWDTKFFKSRLVPISADLSGALRSYMKESAGPSDEASLFTSRDGKPFIHDVVQKAFRKVCRIADVRKPVVEPRDVRMHDLRHSFATHTLVAWYRKGADVQALLPRLSTYLGHIDLRSTQIYLTMTHELLSEASRRFERYASSGKGVGNA